MPTSLSSHFFPTTAEGVMDHLLAKALLALHNAQFAAEVAGFTGTTVRDELDQAIRCVEHLRSELQ